MPLKETCYFYDMSFKCFQHDSLSSSVSRMCAGASQDFLRLCPQSPLLTLGPRDLLWAPEEQSHGWDKIRKPVMVLSAMPWLARLSHPLCMLTWTSNCCEEPEGSHRMGGWGLAGKPEALQHEFGKQATEDMEHLLQQSSQQKSHDAVQRQADGSVALPSIPLASSPSPSHCLLPENQPGQECCLSRSSALPLIVRQRECCCHFCVEPCRSPHRLQPSWPHAERPARLSGAPRGPLAEAHLAAWCDASPHKPPLPSGCWMGSRSEVHASEAPSDETSGGGPPAPGARVWSDEWNLGM